MALKIVHCSDFHIGAPHKELTGAVDARRDEERRASLTAIADFCKEKDVDALILCGDTFDSPEPAEADCEFLRDTLSRLPSVEVFYSLRKSRFSLRWFSLS